MGEVGGGGREMASGQMGEGTRSNWYVTGGELPMRQVMVIPTQWGEVARRIGAFRGRGQGAGMSGKGRPRLSMR